MSDLEFDKMFNVELRNIPKIDKAEFIQIMGKLLFLAKPNLFSCAYEGIDNGKEVVKVTCDNHHCYFVDITGDSLCAIVEDVFDAMSGK